MPGRPVIIQAWTPLSVSYKCILVHEFARPHKFALRLHCENTTELSFQPQEYFTFAYDKYLLKPSSFFNHVTLAYLYSAIFFGYITLVYFTSAILPSLLTYEKIFYFFYECNLLPLLAHEKALGFFYECNLLQDCVIRRLRNALRHASPACVCATGTWLFLYVWETLVCSCMVLLRC